MVVFLVAHFSSDYLCDIMRLCKCSVNLRKCKIWTVLIRPLLCHLVLLLHLQSGVWMD